MTLPAKKYATIKNPTILAVASELFRYNTEKEAEHQLKVIARHFVTSRQQITSNTTPSVHLWIRGYGLEAGEEEQGVLGHFAVISYRKKDGKYVLYATKLHAPAKDHPERKVPKRDNPNFGHPIIRAAQKGKTYPTMEAAQKELDRLHQQFPRLSIPNPAKLYIIIYCGTRPPKERMVKHIIEIQATEEGQYRLSLCENSQKPRNPAKSLPPRKRETADSVGKFTAQVVVRKARKRK